jgi:hypothetical protein
VERVASFYRDVIGLAEVARHLDEQGRLRSIWLDLDGGLLMIEKTGEPTRAVEGVGSGPFLLAFRIRPEERAESERRLVAAGAAIESRTSFTSYARDPEGNRVALSHHPEQPPSHG